MLLEDVCCLALKLLIFLCDFDLSTVFRTRTFSYIYIYIYIHTYIHTHIYIHVYVMGKQGKFDNW
jgi:hypothetical protein